MTVVSNGPDWLPFIIGALFGSYFQVVSFAVVVYDWALTFGQEFELVLGKRWSFMTVLYICVRYIGILYAVINILYSLPVPMTDEDCFVLYFMWTWTPVIINAMLGVIMVIRIHVLYQRSKKMFVFLAVALLAATIASGVIMAIANIGVSAEESIIFGYHMCFNEGDTYQLDLNSESFISTAIWEILAVVLVVWIVIKHFHGLRQSPTGSIIRDCFTVLIQSHALYFVVFAVVACLNLGLLSANIWFSSSVGSGFYFGILQIAQMLQMFVLGPRLILSVREYHAKLVARSDGGFAMTSIYFQARGDALTNGDV